LLSLRGFHLIVEYPKLRESYYQGKTLAVPVPSQVDMRTGFQACIMTKKESAAKLQPLIGWSA
jgi:hypothetical protein